MKTHKNITSIIGSLMILVTITFNHQTIFAQKYYPLAIGNRWDYQCHGWELPPPGRFESDTFMVRITGDTIMTNGKHYLTFTTYRFKYKYYDYWRVDTNNVYRYSIRDSSETLFYKLDAKSGDYWEINFYSIRIGGFGGFDSSIIFGKMTKTLCIGTDGLTGITSHYLAERFGPVRYHWTGEPPGTYDEETTLIGCIINGITYGKLVVNVNEKIQADNFLVYQNTPNPFSSSTTISWQQNQTSITKVNVYNSLGQKVRTLLNDQIDVGKHSLVWDGKNDAGQLLRSGIYFYEIIQSSNRVVKQMVMIK